VSKVLSAFSLRDALACAEASALAYDSATIESALAHVLIQELPDRRIVAFRGTHNPLDWLTDAKIKFAEFPPGSGLYVHSGFLESMLSVRDELINELKALPPKPTIITGHSKGAAEARLFVCGHSMPNLIPSHTFGEPRSLSRKAAILADDYPETGFRWVHEEDCIARAPWLLGRYRHTAQQAFLPSIGSGYILNPPLITLLASDAFGLWAAYRARNVIGLCDDALRDHFIANYLGAIRALSPQTLSGVSA
jgi:hypothetical protein